MTTLREILASASVGVVRVRHESWTDPTIYFRLVKFEWLTELPCKVEVCRLPEAQPEATYTIFPHEFDEPGYVLMETAEYSAGVSAEWARNTQASHRTAEPPPLV